jgi:Na+/H+-translocating membrane pyrophosphatase
MATDVRALPSATLNLYLYPVGAWVILFALLYFAGYPHLALPLCYPLALWQVVLSASWTRSLFARLDRRELTQAECHEGVRSVGQILCWSGFAPAIELLTEDPLAMSAWSAMLGAVTFSAVAWVGILVLTRVPSRVTHVAAVALGCAVLPVNATGTITVAAFIGLFQEL